MVSFFSAGGPDIFPAPRQSRPPVGCVDPQANSARALRRCRKARISPHGRTSNSCSSATKRVSPFSKIKAGDYTTMSAFDYDYSPGSGEDQVPAPSPAIAAAPTQVFQGSSHRRCGCSWGSGRRYRSGASSRARNSTSPVRLHRSPRLLLNLAHSDQGRRFRVLVSPGGGAAPVAAGAITVFGVPHHGPTTFTVPLPENLGVTAAAAGNVPLDIRVVPIGPALGPAAARAVATPPQVTAIQVRTN